jgi:hypothetical protein
MEDQWISVNDMLPKEEGTYKVMKIYSTEPETGLFTGTAFTNYDGYRVTHWMPLPAPPLTNH